MQVLAQPAQVAVANEGIARQVSVDQIRCRCCSFFLILVFLVFYDGYLQSLDVTKVRKCTVAQRLDVVVVERQERQTRQITEQVGPYARYLVRVQQPVGNHFIIVLLKITSTLDYLQQLQIRQSLEDAAGQLGYLVAVEYPVFEASD